MKKLLMLIALSAFLSPIYAETMSGNELKERADAYARHLSNTATADDYTKTIHLMGYIMGVHDAMYGINICPAKTVSVAQMIEVTRLFMQNNPDLLHKPAAQIVYVALSRSFPCPK